MIYLLSPALSDHLSDKMARNLILLNQPSEAEKCNLNCSRAILEKKFRLLPSETKLVLSR